MVGTVVVVVVGAVVVVVLLAVVVGAVVILVAGSVVGLIVVVVFVVSCVELASDAGDKDVLAGVVVFVALSETVVNSVGSSVPRVGSSAETCNARISRTFRPIKSTEELSFMVNASVYNIPNI